MVICTENFQKYAEFTNSNGGISYSAAECADFIWTAENFAVNGANGIIIIREKIITVVTYEPHLLYDGHMTKGSTTLFSTSFLDVSSQFDFIEL